MNSVFLKGFLKAISEIKDKKLGEQVASLIETFEKSPDLKSIQNVKKLIGHRHAYRVRIGNYRLGFFYSNGPVTFADFDHRKDIYKKFP